jgi:pilus assembly protein Flp/PilA
MTALQATIQKFIADEDGSTAVEYAMVAGGIAVVIAASIFGAGTLLKGKYEDVDKAFN